MVKIPTKGKVAPQGSFGLPENVQKALNQRENEKRYAKEESDEPTPPPRPKPQVSEDDGFDKKISEDPTQFNEELTEVEKEIVSLQNPINRLKAIGIELSEDDFHQYLFKGYLSKTVDLTKGLKKDMSVTLKTLTTEEYLLVDKFIAEAIDAKRSMTREGVEQLRSVYTLAFGVTHLAGKPIIKSTDKSTLYETAMAASEVITALSAGLVTKIIKLHMIFTISMNKLIDSGDSPFLKST